MSPTTTDLPGASKSVQEVKQHLQAEQVTLYKGMPFRLIIMLFIITTTIIQKFESFFKKDILCFQRLGTLGIHF